MARWDHGASPHSPLNSALKSTMFSRVNLIARLLILIELHHRVNFKIRVLHLDVEAVKNGLLHLLH